MIALKNIILMLFLFMAVPLEELPVLVFVYLLFPLLHIVRHSAFTSFSVV